MIDYAKRILEAYCNELQEIINIEQARDVYQEKDQELTFSCSDRSCCQLVVAVNYKEENTIRAAHFRRHNKHIHSQDCVWGHYQEVLLEMLANRQLYEASGGNLFKAFEKVESSEVFDIFLPIKKAYKKQSELSKLTRANVLNYIRNHRKSTNKLQLLVEIFELMSENDKKKAKLKINEQVLSYYQIFKPIAYIEEQHTYPHIYYGEAKIYKYSNDGFTVFFKSKALNYNDKNKNLKITIFIPNNSVNTSLYEKLQQISVNNEKVTCYIFGQDRHTLCTEKALNYQQHCRDSSLPCVTFCNYTFDNIVFSKK